MNKSSVPPLILIGLVQDEGNKFILRPADGKKTPVELDKRHNLSPGDLAKVEMRKVGGYNKIISIQNYGPCTVEKINNLMVEKKYEIPELFSPEAMEECTRFPDFEDTRRKDMTKLPFVTIDGDDSRDFDDAVYARETITGFHLKIAIADVSFYVKPHTALDQEACHRGNSVYLPHRVIPMLPEILSNNLCSLNPKVRRPALVCSIRIDRDGNLKKWNFERAVIKSAARLTYKEVENALNGKFNATTKKLRSKVICPLYEAYLALRKASEKRGALELETPEIKVKFNQKNQIKDIEKIVPLTSNNIIEEFMIAANVAAARFLQERKIPTLYRIHAAPPQDKLEEIRPVLHTVHIPLPAYADITPRFLNNVLKKCKKSFDYDGMNDVILRVLSQAQYSPDNIGHFGLNLPEYLHFTSPIRRYADLTVHRNIVYACQLEDTPPPPLSRKCLKYIGSHLETTERQAVNAERDTLARYLALYICPKIGETFEAVISGLSSAGIFARIKSNGIEGLVPMRFLPEDKYILLEGGTFLLGRKTKHRFYIGDTIQIQIADADPITGKIGFSYTPEQNINPKRKRFTKLNKPAKKKKAAQPDADI